MNSLYAQQLRDTIIDEAISKANAEGRTDLGVILHSLGLNPRTLTAAEKEYIEARVL